MRSEYEASDLNSTVEISDCSVPRCILTAVKSDPERGKPTSIIFTFTITIRSTLFLYLHDILMAKFIVKFSQI
jgi:hypothetical protein